MGLPQIDPPRRRPRRRPLQDVVLKTVRTLALPFVPALVRRYPTPEVTLLTMPMAGIVEGGSIRLIFVSDLHSGPYHRRGFFAGVAAMIQAQRGDLLILGGDYAGQDLSSLDDMVEVLGDVRPDGGGYFVLGNHDHHDGAIRVSRALEGAGFEDLTNRGRRVASGGSSVWLCGVDDMEEGFPDPVASLRGRAPGDAAVLVSHNPDVVEHLAPGSVDLVLSGHTHGGQVKLLGAALMTNSRAVGRQGSGLFSATPGPMYVSRGIGSVYLPVRHGAPPEIVVVDLVASPSAT